MKNFKKAVVLALSLTLLSLAGHYNEATAAPEKSATPAAVNYAWASGSIGGSSYTMVEALASTASKYVTSRNSSVSTSGSLENALLVHRGEVQFGMVASDSLFSAYNGAPPFPEKVKCSQLFAYTSWSVPMFVRADSGIDSVDQLVGRKISVGNAGQAASQMWLAILKEYGILDKVRWQYMSYVNSSDALQAGQIDSFPAAVVLGEIFDSNVTQLVRTVALKPVKVDQDILARVLAKNSGLKNITTSGASFKAFTPDVQDQGDIGNTAIVVCNPNLPEEDVYQIVKALLEHTEELNLISKQFKAFDPEFAVKMMLPDYPVHPGAVRYFKEIGVM